MYVGAMPAAQERSSLEASLSDSEEESTEENSNEYVTVSLNEIRKEMQCPICLGIIRKTRTVMECLHRFCRECIDKAMRLGNNECPACRTHCASRRSLRDDPNFDSLIASIYPDVDKYEEEEMALLEEDTRRNKQIQANIAETFRRQSEALVRRRTTAKATAAAIVRKAHGKFRSVQGRTRGKGRGKGKWKDDFIYEDDEEYYMNREDEPSSAQETRRLPARKRQKPSTVETSYNDDQSGTDDNSEREEMHNDETDESGRSMKSVSRESNDASPVTAGNGEGMVTWARACARSHTRYGSLSGGNNKHIRCMRATVLLESLAATRRENEDEYDIHFTLKPMPDEGTKLPSLDRPNLCTSSNITIQHLCRFLASQLSGSTNSEVEIVVEKILDPREFGIPTKSKGKSATGKPECYKVIDVLDSTATLSNIYSAYWNRHDNLALFYRPKV